MPQPTITVEVQPRIIWDSDNTHWHRCARCQHLWLHTLVAMSAEEYERRHHCSKCGDEQRWVYHITELTPSERDQVIEQLNAYKHEQRVEALKSLFGDF